MDLLADITKTWVMGNWTAEACLRLVLAAVLGGVIGIEREHHGRSAGFRTQILVALGAALAMVVSLEFGIVFGGEGANSAFRVDPARVAYGVMGGIGFLGAGAIVKSGVNVRGMTTAASLWCTAAMGLACGFGMYGVSLVGTGIVLVALFFLGRVDQLITIHWYRTVIVKMKSTGQDHLARLRQMLKDQGIAIIWDEYERDFVGKTETLRLHIRISAKQKPTSANWFEGLEDILEYQVH